MNPLCFAVFCSCCPSRALKITYAVWFDRGCCLRRALHMQTVVWDKYQHAHISITCLDVRMCWTFGYTEKQAPTLSTVMRLHRHWTQALSSALFRKMLARGEVRLDAVLSESNDTPHGSAAIWTLSSELLDDGLTSCQRFGPWRSRCLCCCLKWAGEGFINSGDERWGSVQGSNLPSSRAFDGAHSAKLSCKQTAKRFSIHPTVLLPDAYWSVVWNA